MPTYKDETQQYHIERVREVLALKPRAGARTIREVLEGDHDAPLALDIHYILNLKKKIAGERIHRFDQAKVDERLAELQDRTESVIAQMWRILLNSTAEDKDRVAAAKTIIDADYKFFEAQLNAGIFERKLGTLDVSHKYELTMEQRTLIIHAFTNYGIIQPANN